MAQLRNIDIMIRVNQKVPPQLLLSKPVILLDARGRYAPFHVEFIDSAEVSSPSTTFCLSTTYFAYIGFCCRPEGPVQGHRPTQNRIRRICARGLKTKTRFAAHETLGGHR